MQQDPVVSDAKDGDSSEIDPAEKALVQRWQGTIEKTKGSEENKKFLEDIKRHRQYEAGIVGKEDGKDKIARANLIYSTIQTIHPRVYSKNPEIAVTPDEAVDEHTYQAVKGFSRTLGIVINKQLKGAKLKKRAKQAVRSAMVTSVGWVKIIYQQEFGKDPIIQERISDIQDNLQRIQFLIKQIEGDNVTKADNEVYEAELRDQLRVLEEQVEVVVAEGMVIDCELSENILIDPDVKSAYSYQNAKWIAHRVWYRKDEHKSTFKQDVEKATLYNKTGDETNESENAFIAVWEIWDRISNTVYTITEGCEGWARAPYTPDVVGERFFPFFMLFFNPLDGQFHCLSDVQLLEKLQDEYHELREQLSEHRSLHKPHWITDGDTEENDIKSFTKAGLGEVVIVDAHGLPLRDVFQAAEAPRIDQAVYDTTHIRTDFELVAGAGDSARGSVSKAKTATEAEILEAGLSSRTDERKDTVEDWLQEIAQYSAELLLQILSPEQVERLAGPGYVWPEMPKEEVFDLVSIEIRAGSTGKPNKLQDQKTWLEFIPELKELIKNVAELRASGQFELAEVLINVARETLRRFDERIDVEEFLPQMQQPNINMGAAVPATPDQGGMI